MTRCFMVFLKRITGRATVPIAQGSCVVDTQELNPLSALNSSLWVVVVTSYSTCNYPPALGFPQLEVKNIIPSCRESMVHHLPTYGPKSGLDGEYDWCCRRGQSSSTGGGEARDSCDNKLV